MKTRAWSSPPPRAPPFLLSLLLLLLLLFSAAPAWAQTGGHVEAFTWENDAFNGWRWETASSEHSQGTGAGDMYGYSVGCSGRGGRSRWRVVAYGTPGDDDGGVDSGSVSIYEWSGYTFSSRFISSDKTTIVRSPGAGAGFGRATSASVTPYPGDNIAFALVAVGAPHLQSGTGAVYVYHKYVGDRGGDSSESSSIRSTAWTLGATLQAPDKVAGDLYGFSVAVAASEGLSWLAVGAPNKASSTGAVYVYRRAAGASGAWTYVGKIGSGMAAGDKYGFSMAMRFTPSVGFILVVGAPYDDDKGTNSVYNTDS